MQREKEYYTSLFKEWKNSLSDEEKKILFRYSDNFYNDVNSYLLESGGTFFNSKYEKEIKILDSALNYELKERIKVFRAEYREISIDKILLGYEAVEEIIDIYPNYMSTSFTRGKAIKHLGILRNSQILAKSFLLFTSDVDKGVKCGYLDEELSSMGETEDEILILRGVVQKIKSFQKMSGFEDVIEIFSDVSRL